jgi:hypothetical protein
VKALQVKATAAALSIVFFPSDSEESGVTNMLKYDAIRFNSNSKVNGWPRPSKQSEEFFLGYQVGLRGFSYAFKVKGLPF